MVLACLLLLPGRDLPPLTTPLIFRRYLVSAGRRQRAFCFPPVNTLTGGHFPTRLRARVGRVHACRSLCGGRTAPAMRAAVPGAATATRRTATSVAALARSSAATLARPTDGEQVVTAPHAHSALRRARDRARCGRRD